MTNNIPNNWDIQSLLALTYLKRMHIKETIRILDKYSSFDDFKENAFFFQPESITDDTLSEYYSFSGQQLELALQKNYKIITF